jgi:hypothetical protein
MSLLDPQAQQGWIFILLLAVVAAFYAPYLIRHILREKNKSDRAETILSRQDEWGEETCQALVKGEVRIGMTKEMVHKAFGPPSKIDHQRQRWSYAFIYEEFFVGPGGGDVGPPYGCLGWSPSKSGTNYVWFTDDEVTKIEQRHGFKRLVDDRCAPHSSGCAFFIGFLASSLIFYLSVVIIIGHW